MKIKEVIEVRSRYSFEAPVVRASVRKNERPAIAAPLTDINITDSLVPDPSKVFVVRVNGESMIDRNIFDGDVLLVEKADRAKDGQIVVASVNGEMAVKTYRTVKGHPYLFAENEKFVPLKISEFYNFQIQGIVRHVIRGV
jgi:DNA polymerase V